MSFYTKKITPTFPSFLNIRLSCDVKQPIHSHSLNNWLQYRDTCCNIFLGTHGPTRLCHYVSLSAHSDLCRIDDKMVREKVRDLTQSYDKSPYTSRNVKRAKWQHKQRHKMFDYTAVADRLRTASWSNYGHPTGVVNLVYGPNLPTPRNSRVIKRTHVQKLVNKPPYIDNKPTATPSEEVIKIDTRKTLIINII